MLLAVRGEKEFYVKVGKPMEILAEQQERYEKEREEKPSEFEKAEGNNRPFDKVAERFSK